MSMGIGVGIGSIPSDIVNLPASSKTTSIYMIYESSVNKVCFYTRRSLCCAHRIRYTGYTVNHGDGLNSIRYLSLGY